MFIYINNFKVQFINGNRQSTREKTQVSICAHDMVLNFVFSIFLFLDAAFSGICATLKWAIAVWYSRLRTALLGWDETVAKSMTHNFEDLGKMKAYENDRDHFGIFSCIDFKGQYLRVRLISYTLYIHTLFCAFVLLRLFSGVELTFGTSSDFADSKVPVLCERSSYGFGTFKSRAINIWTFRSVELWLLIYLFF